MRKVNDIIILIIGIILFIISYNFDQPISLFFKDVKFPLFDIIFSVITNFGIVILIMLAIPSIIFYKKNRKLIYLMWFIFLASFILAFAIKLIFLRQRPIDLFTFPFTSIINYSFPSMHAMVIFSLLPILIKYLPKQKIFWISFSLLAIFGRIYFGFHFLSDVVFGTLFGYFIGAWLLELFEKGKLWK
jgi:undecaprenyl-diphosphatase